ncbi:MAG: DUF3147 family protein [Candidatus Zophobacter franzmannii]|nr:DUF3147 family protein [Candidatus Zophobacter franzmannii]
MQFAIKTLISAVIIVLISEISKRFSIVGGILASLPLVSFLAIIWLYLDTKDIKPIIALSESIFWLVIPSLLFFVIFPILLKKGVAFWSSFGISAGVMIVFYFIMVKILQYFNVIDKI